MALSGVVEGTGAAFANTWKTQAACPNAKSSFEDPCSLSVENGTWTSAGSRKTARGLSTYFSLSQSLARRPLTLSWGPAAPTPGSW